MSGAIPDQDGTQSFWHLPAIDGRALAILIGIAALTFASSWSGMVLTRAGGQIPSLWITNGIALGLLLRRLPVPQGALLGTVLAANLVANLVAGIAVALAIGLVACNAIEIVVALLLRRIGRIDPSGKPVFGTWGELGAIGRLVLYCGILAPAASAIPAAGILYALGDSDFLTNATRWFFAHGLGMILMAPLVLVARRNSIGVRTAAGTAELLAILACALVSTVLIFSQDAYPLTFVILPVLTLAAFRLCMFDALLSVFLVTIAATGLTLHGLGPIAATVPGIESRIMFLQIFLAINIITILPVAAVLNERAKIQRALVQASADANAALAAKSDFLATMSHEIRTPMTGVLGMIELLRTDPSERDKQRFLSSLQRSAKLLMSVLNDVLDFSKLESGKIDLEAIDFDLRQLACATLDLFATAANEKHLTMALDFPAGDAVVIGDPVRLEQVLSNLVSNAIKFTAVGKIDLTIAAQFISEDRRLWTIAVTDTGMGIEPDQIEQLFSPFVQADASTTRRFGGTGLGLAICRRLVEAMDGKLEVEATAGLGSTFKFSLDLPSGKLAPEVPASEENLSKALPLTILLAEDNPVNRLLVTTLLRRMGHRVSSVVNGREAVEAVAAGSFDVILMDMQMPEMDGLAATRAIRGADHNRAGIPIVALTADASSDRRRFYDNVGLNGFLTKPIDGARLRTCLAAFSAAPEEGLPPPFNSAKLDEIATAIGSDNLVALLDMLAIDLVQRPRAMAALVRRGDLASLRNDCHALRGAAASIGADVVARTAAALEAADDDPAVAARLLPAFTSAVEAALRAIPALRRQLCPDLPLADAG